MSTECATTTRLYLYAIVWSKHCDEMVAHGFNGLESQPLAAITAGDLGVMVSQTSLDKFRPQRKLLSAHQEVVTQLSTRWSALPVSFGLAADSYNEVAELLRKHHDVLAAQLRKVEGRVEMAVTLRWKCDNVFAYLLQHNPELAKVRDDLAGQNIDRDTQMAAGRLVESVLNSERSRHADVVLESLRPMCAELEAQPLRQDQEIVRLACLVKREQQEAFEQAVYQVASKFNEEFEFGINGPFPPYSFVKLSLALENQ